MNRERIRQKFSRACSTYNQHAVVQAQMADTLVQAIAAHQGTDYHRVLEIGCGTGLLTRRLLTQLRCRELSANDLVADCGDILAREISPAIRFFPGPAEELPASLAGFDLIVSNAALHWIQPLPAFIGQLSALLAPGGTLAFTTFGPANYREINALVPLPRPYRSLAAWAELATPEFSVLHAAESCLQLTFADPRAVLQHIRCTGVNALTTTSWSRRQLHCFYQDYQSRFGSAEGVTLTYHPQCLVWKKTSCQSSL